MTLTGDVAYLYAFDVAYEMRRDPARRQLLGQPLEPLALDGDKRNPRRLLLHRPLMARLPAVERPSPLGTLRIERTVKVLHVGAISLCLRVPFSVGALGELVRYHDLGLDGGTLDELARALAEEVRADLAELWVRPRGPLPPEEAYTVFCLRAEPKDSREWLAMHRREVAALLTQEPDPILLSDQETDESLAHALSYYRHDLAVLDWDAALLIDQPKALDETLHILELANLELGQLEAYDATLDGVLERAYRDVGDRPRLIGRNRVLRELGELRIDLARLNDELVNFTKFFGDWHLARVYTTMAGRFHLAEWQRSIDAKLRTLDEIYQLLKQDLNNRLMLILEAMIVLLFIVDLFLIFYMGH